MNIRGMIKFSLVDYPGKISCVLFVGNCNMRCAFCHNPHLVFDPESQPLIREAQALNFLKTRVKKLDGVVISGGEPTLRKSLPDFTDKVVSMGFLVKIDTNGSNPSLLKERRSKGALHALGIDYKAPAKKYCQITGHEDQSVASKIRESIEFAVKEGIQLDVRTTVHKSLLSFDDLKAMREELRSMGVSSWTLQQFNPVEVISEKLKDEPSYGDLELLAFSKALGDTKVRGLKGVYLD